MKKSVLFFSRTGYHDLFCKLQSSRIDAAHIVLNEKEKAQVLEQGGEVVGCLEEEYEDLPVASFSRSYLRNGFQPDRFLGDLSLAERHRVLGKEIEFVRRIFGNHQYDAIVHDTVSIEIEEVVSIEAARHGIKDLNFLPSVVDDYFLWKPDPYSSSLPKEMLSRAEPVPTHRTDAAAHVDKVLKKGHYPDYLDIKSSLYAPSSIRRHARAVASQAKQRIKDFVLSQDSASREKKLKRALMYYYDQTDQRPIDKLLDAIYASLGHYDSIGEADEHSFVFYPLHFEPEATLRYFSPRFSNQVSVIDTIARNLPMDQNLVVKEHPSQPYYSLRKEYQRLRRANSNILCLPPDIPSETLIQKSEKVVTVSGTVGWEALVYERPVIVLGNVFYDKHPGVTKVGSTEALRKALRGEVKEPCPPEVSTDYLARVLSHASRGRLHRKHWDESSNVENIRKALEKQLA